MNIKVSVPHFLSHLTNEFSSVTLTPIFTILKSYSTSGSICWYHISKFDTWVLLCVVQSSTGPYVPIRHNGGIAVSDVMYVQILLQDVAFHVSGNPGHHTLKEYLLSFSRVINFLEKVALKNDLDDDFSATVHSVTRA